MKREVEHKLKAIMLDAKEQVKDNNGYNVDIGHVVVSTIADDDNRALTVLNHMRIDTDALHDRLYQEVYTMDMTPKPVDVKDTDIGHTAEMKAVFKLLEVEAIGLGEHNIDTAHLFLSILKRDTPTRHIMNQFGVNYADFKDAIIIMSRFDESEEDDYESSGHNRPKRPKGRGVLVKGIKATPTLDQYCRDVTEAVKNGEVDPVVGREKEIKRVSMILSRRKKNNPVLIGEPGVGKTSIIEGLAKLIQEKKAPRVIAKKRIYSLNLAALVAGTKYRGQFEERVKAMMDELKEDKDIILFIDELHTMVGAGNASGSLDASNIFKPALANGELQIIGATTLDEFRENIEKDGALTRRFQQVLIEEPTLEETIHILNNIKDRYEKHHKVIYTQEAIEECVKLSNRYIGDRAMPDKAIDVMDEAGAATNLTQKKPERIIALEEARAKVDAAKEVVVNKQLYEEAAKLRDEGESIEKDLVKAIAEWEKSLDDARTEVGIDDISEVVSNMTGIPLSKVNSQENKRLLNMDKVLKKSIVGQDAAIDTVTRAIKRSRLGIKDEGKPIGSFIFLGPTGVGKTELAKRLAEEIFGDVDAVVRMDMSEYMEKFSVTRLVGPPPGYVGYDQGGQLTEKVRKKPYSIILFDEIEKAHSDVFNILLQLLDEGQLTDGIGRKVDFKNCLIILTSNIGVKELSNMGEGLGFKTNNTQANKDAKSRAIIEKALKKKFAPEFLNRIDDCIIFESLKPADIDKIIHIELDKWKNRLMGDRGVELKLDKSAIDFLAKEGYHEEYGARPLERVIKIHVGDLISDEILSGELKKGDTILISFDKKEGKVYVKK